MFLCLTNMWRGLPIRTLAIVGLCSSILSGLKLASLLMTLLVSCLTLQWETVKRKWVTHLVIPLAMNRVSNRCEFLSRPPLDLLTVLTTQWRSISPRFLRLSPLDVPCRGVLKSPLLATVRFLSGLVSWFRARLGSWSVRLGVC